MKKVTEGMLYSNGNYRKVSITETDKLFTVVKTDVGGSKSINKLKKVENLKYGVSYLEARNIDDVRSHLDCYSATKVIFIGEQGYDEALAEFNKLTDAYNKKQNSLNTINEMLSLSSDQFDMRFKPKDRIHQILRSHPEKLNELAELKPLFDKMKSAIDDVYNAIYAMEKGVYK